MKRLKTFSIIMLLAFVMAMPANADSDLEFSGQVRLRDQLDGLSFVKDAHKMTFSEMRTRFALSATVDGNAHVFVQFQDSRIAGANNQSGSLAATENVDLHQAYILIDNFYGENWGIKGGRFEFAQGNERVFGAVNWDNVARAWEGGLLSYQAEEFKVTAFGFKRAERMAADKNLDFDVTGVYANIDLSGAKWDLFAVYELDASEPPALPDRNNLDRISIGTYYQRQQDKLDFVLNAVYQMGNILDTIDIAAYLFALEIGYSLEGDRNTRLAAGIDYTTGDDGKDATKFKTYNNMYWTGHKFAGWMDYFLGGGPNGLMDIVFKGRTDITDGWTAGGDLHFFSSAQDYMWDAYNAGADTVATKDVGMEVDLWVKTSRIAGVGISGGISYFAAKDAFAYWRNGAAIFDNNDAVDKKAGIWAWSMATVNF